MLGAGVAEPVPGALEPAALEPAEPAARLAIKDGVDTPPVVGAAVGRAPMLAVKP